MDLPVFGGLRARRIARLLDETRGQRQARPQGPADDDMANLVDIADRLGSLKADLQPRPGFREELRAQLMATAQREGIGATAVRNYTGPARVAAPRQRRRARPTAGLVAASVATAAIGLTAASVAATGAVPGDTLYSIKRSGEQARLAMARSQIERGRLLLEFAQTRMSEADAVAGDATELPGILDLMDAETREGVALLTSSALDHHDQPNLDTIAAFSAAQHSAMPDVLADITGSAHARAVYSLVLLNQVDARVAGLRAYVRCADPSPVRSDDLGPKPHPCPTQTLADQAPDNLSAPAPTATQASPVPPPAPVPELPSPQATPAQGPIPTPVPPAPIVPAPQPTPTPAGPVTAPTPAGPVMATTPAGTPVTEPPLGVPDLDPTAPAPTQPAP